MTEPQPAAHGTAWDRLSPATGIDRRVVITWLEWIGFNRAAPDDLLVGLLDLDLTGFLHRDDLPEGVVDAALVHPSRRVRGGVAEIHAARPGPVGEAHRRLAGAGSA